MFTLPVTLNITYTRCVRSLVQHSPSDAGRGSPLVSFALHSAMMSETALLYREREAGMSFNLNHHHVLKHIPRTPSHPRPRSESSPCPQTQNQIANVRYSRHEDRTGQTTQDPRPTLGARARTPTHPDIDLEQTHLIVSRPERHDAPYAHRAVYESSGACAWVGVVL